MEVRAHATTCRVTNAPIGSPRTPRNAPLSSRLETAGLATLAAVLLVGTIATSMPKRPSAQTATITVQPGDTVWDLAARYPVSGLSTDQTVDLIASINHVDGLAIRAGDTLAVPEQPRDSLLAVR